MIIKNQFLFHLIFLITSFSFSQNITVANLTEYNTAIKNASPGTTIILKNGIWKDVHLKAYGKGDKENPIIIKAEKPGEVIISGDSKLQIYGEYIIIQGLWFKDGNPTSKSIISFKKNSTEYANNCRFTHNTISYYNPSDDLEPSIKTHWVDLWGKNNRVDHNNFTGKTNAGTTLVVWLKGEEHTENNHLIDANFFGPRPELGTNGGETIRIGTSKTSLSSSKTTIENNTFKNCDGEIEIISNKSCDNIFRNNLFLSSQGSLTLRHGNNALVENNVFIGNNVSKTGGIRVINEGHIIRNNLLIGLKGTGNRSPITIMNGVPNSPLNRYNQVKNVSIQNNTLINCSPMQFANGKSDELSLPPINIVFANNLIANTISKNNILQNSDDISGIKFINNVTETIAEVNATQFKKETITWNDLRNLPMPSNTNKNLTSDYIDSNSPKLDMTGAERTNYVVGAFNLENTEYPKALKVKTGPYWNPKIDTPKNLKFKKIKVEPGVGTLSNAIKKATTNTVLELKDGIYILEKEQKINSSITIIGDKNTIIQANKESKAFKSFFKINGGINFKIKNLHLDGKTQSMKYAIISPSENVSDIYNLSIENCSFTNFNNSKGAILKAYPNTIADTISIKNSTFKNSFRGINFYSKENVIGNINAKNFIIKNSVFKDIDEYALKYVVKNFTSGGVISSQPMGYIDISNSVFSNVDNREKGQILQIKGIAITKIHNSVFEKSSNIVSLINLKGTQSSIANCLVSLSGTLKVGNGAIKKDIFYKNPKWEDSKMFIPSKKSILLKENNKTENIGLIKIIKSESNI